MQQQKHRPGHLRRTHAASLAANRDPLSMAEELLQKQQHNLELQDQLKHVLTNQRHLEVELNTLRAAYGSKQRQQPGTESLIPPGSSVLDTLQYQAQALREAQQQACVHEALAGHTACVLQQIKSAAQAAACTSGAEAHTTTDGAQRLAAHVLDILEAFQEPAVAPTPCSTPVSSLAVAQSAHKLLLQQAVLLRGKLTPSPVDSSTPDACTTSGTSRQSSSSGNKARELACFLQSHVNRMQGLLHTLPGGGNASAGQAAAAAATTLQACPATASSAVRPRTASPVCRSALPHTQRPGSALVAPSYTSSPAGACLSAATTAGASDIMHQQQQQQPYQLTASAPDLRPYLHFPPRRPGSAAPCTGVSAHHRQQQQHDASPASSADAESNALHVQELQCALATRDALLMQQRQECSELQEQLQAAVQELGAVQEQWRASEAAVNTLHAQAADAAQTNSTLATQLAAAEQQLQQCRQQCSELRLQVQQLQDNSHDVGHQGQHAEQLQAERLASAVLTGQISQLQAVLAEAEVQVQELQRQLHTQQVQHIQAQAELMEQLEAAVEAATRAQQQSSASVEAGGSLSDPGGVGRCSGNTEALVCEVAQTSVAVAQCMDDLQEVVASTRRVTAMGLLGAPQLVKRFSQLDVEWEKKGDGYLASAAGRRTGDSD